MRIRVYLRTKISESPHCRILYTHIQMIQYEGILDTAQERRQKLTIHPSLVKYNNNEDNISITNNKRSIYFGVLHASATTVNCNYSTNQNRFYLKSISIFFTRQRNVEQQRHKLSGLKILYHDLSRSHKAP